MAISFKDKIEELQGKQLRKVLASNISNIPAACRKMGFKPLKEIDGVYIANRGKVFDSIIVGSGNEHTFAVLVRRGGEMVPLADPDEQIENFIASLDDELNKSQKAAAVARQIAGLIQD
jgi:hypothetical protein